MRSTWMWVVCLAACRGPNPAYLESSWDAASADVPVAGAGGAGGDEAGIPGDPADGPIAGLMDADLSVPDALVPDEPLADEPVADVAALEVPAAEAPVVDLAPVADLAPDVFTPPAGCGTGAADITGISDADGVVVDTDGSVYFLTDDAVHSYVGRIRPGQPPELNWARVDNSPTTWGLALDSAKKRVYVLVVDGVGALVAFDNIQGAPIGSKFVTGIDNGNDVVVAADGTVYYSQQGDRQIYSVPRTGGVPKVVTTMPVGLTSLKQLPAALAFTAEGDLLVGLDHGGSIFRITLAGGREASRSPLGSWMGWANGLAFDRLGLLYVSIYDDTEPRSVVRIEPDGSTTTITAGGRFSSIAFGRGVLDCRDLYVADPFGPMRRVHVPDSL
jgi:hypothetical protein